MCTHHRIARVGAVTSVTYISARVNGDGTHICGVCIRMLVQLQHTKECLFKVQGDEGDGENARCKLIRTVSVVEGQHTEPVDLIGSPHNICIYTSIRTRMRMRTNTTVIAVVAWMSAAVIMPIHAYVQRDIAFTHSMWVPYALQRHFDQRRHP